MLKQLVITFALVSFFGVFALAQEQTETTTKEKKECAKGCCSGNKSHSMMQMSYMDTDSTHQHPEMKSDSKMRGMHHEMKSEHTDENPIIRKGEINLSEIDKNEDGKVYQDQMCWNVISDQPGECPQCGMILKEVSLEKAKENLINHDYKVKE